jgi:transcriptional regulator with XRE-family HTH domain
MKASLMGVSFKEWLNVRRKRAELSQSALAQKLGVTRQTISNWERGGTPEGISLTTAAKLAEALDVDLPEVSRAVQGKGVL